MTARWGVRARLAVAACVAALLATSAPADAERHPVHPGVVSANPADTTPDVLDGQVNAVVQIGSTIVVGGSFTAVAQGGTTYQRRNLFAFDAATGAVSESFRPRVRGPVLDLQPSRDRSSVYVVGDFTSVNKQPKTRRMARLKVATGKVDAGFRSPGFDRVVADIAYAQGRYYVTGSFTTVGGKPRGYVAALTPRGRDSGAARVRFAGTNRDGRTHVRAMDVAPNGKTMVVVGNFMRVNGKARAQVAVLRLQRQSVSLRPWATARFAPRCGPHFDSYLRDVAISPGGGYFVVATTGGPKGVQSSGLLCDTLSRWNLGGAGKQQPAWVNYTGGDTLTQVIADANAVYVGGHQRWLNNSYGKNSAGPGAVERPGIAAVDPVNGMPYTWNPTRPRGVGVSAFTLTKGGLWVGHDTASLGGEPRQRLAYLPASGGTALPPYRTAPLPGTLTLLGKGVSDTVVASDFTGKVSQNARPVASTQDWSESTGAFLVDKVLYAGWSDGTMTAQTYDGVTLGAPTAVDLHGAFRDLRNARGMFFDRATHRVYYTVGSSPTLYYRYFQPQSRLVGSWRFAAPRTASMDWSRFGGGFIVGKQLYFVDQPTASLRKVGWSAGTAKAVGKPVTVLGPKLDHVSYRTASITLAP